jgi:hypothetical protein
MKKSVYILFVFFVSCAGLKNTGDNSEPAVTTAINIQVGGSYGGFVDNTETDAVSGATSMQYSLGIHPEIWIKNHVIETGLEYVNFNQTLTYSDNEIFGDRTYNYGQLHIPLTYNFKIVKNGVGNHPLFYVKLGINYGLQLYTSDESSTTYLPAYSFKKSSFGPYLGISTAPLIINYKWYTGFYCNFFRGTKIYEDPYHMSNDYGNMSYLNFGIIFRYKDDKSLH